MNENTFSKQFLLHTIFLTFLSDSDYAFQLFEDRHNIVMKRNEHPEFAKALRQQTELMGRLLEVLKLNLMRQKKSDFDMLLADLKNRNNSTTAGGGERITEKATFKTTTKPSTIITLIDESEVRQALKNDPFVKRILRISGKRREDYFRGMAMKDTKKTTEN